MNNYTK